MSTLLGEVHSRCGRGKAIKMLLMFIPNQPYLSYYAKLNYQIIRMTLVAFVITKPRVSCYDGTVLHQKPHSFRAFCNTYLFLL